MKVVVFQCPCGIAARQRSPQGDLPRSLDIFVDRPIALNRRMPCSQAPTPGPNTGRPSPRSSKRPSSMTLSHLPIWPTSSPRSSMATRTASSTNCCLEPAPRSQKPSPWPENTAYRALGTWGADSGKIICDKVVPESQELIIQITPEYINSKLFRMEFQRFGTVDSGIDSLSPSILRPWN